MSTQVVGHCHTCGETRDLGDGSRLNIFIGHNTLTALQEALTRCGGPPLAESKSTVLNNTRDFVRDHESHHLAWWTSDMDEPSWEATESDAI